MSYIAQPKVAMYCSCGAKKYGFGSTNAATFWYLVVLKSYSTTNKSSSNDIGVIKPNPAQLVGPVTR